MGQRHDEGPETRRETRTGLIGDPSDPVEADAFGIAFTRDDVEIQGGRLDLMRHGKLIGRLSLTREEFEHLAYSIIGETERRFGSKVN